MDPVSTAIVAAVAKLSEPIVKDAYEGFKTLLQRKFGAGTALTTAIDAVEGKPESVGRREVLQEEIASAQAGSDAEIVDAAESLLRNVQKASPGRDAVNRVVQNVEGDNHIFSGTGNVTVNRGDAR